MFLYVFASKVVINSLEIFSLWLCIMIFSFLKAFSEVAYLKQGNQAWFCLDLIQVLCQLAEQGNAIAVRGILSSPIGHCAGVLLLGVSQIKVQFYLSIP